MAAGMHPNAMLLDVLFERCAIEPDFFVRDMLTWAILRHDRAATVDRLLRELRSDTPQARSQALHTLSKIGDPRTWAAITNEHLLDQDDEVACTAWRTAAILVPDEEATALAETLSTQFNRGGRDVRLSLSRALAALGSAASAVITRARVNPDAGVREHAIATERLIDDAIAAEATGRAARRAARHGRADP